MSPSTSAPTTEGRDSPSPPAVPGRAPQRPAAVASATLAEAEKHIRHGAAALASQRLLEAYESFRRAAELVPWDTRPHMGLGEFYGRIDRVEEAEQHFRTALQCDPTNVRARVLLSRVLRDLGKTQETLGLLLPLAESPSCDPTVWLELGRGALRLGTPREAIPWLERYVEARPRSAHGLAVLGRAYAEARDLDAAETRYSMALVVDRREPFAWLWLGQLLVSRNRRDEADKALTTFRELRDLADQLRVLERDLLRRPEDVNVLVRIAKTQYQLGRARAALAALDRALGLKPADTDLRKLRDGIAKALPDEVETEESFMSSR